MPPTPGPSSLKRSASEPDDALRDLKKSKREEKEKKKRRKKKRKTSVVQALRPTPTPAALPADDDSGDEERTKNKGKGRAISSELPENTIHGAGDQLTGVIASTSTSAQVQTAVEIARSRAKRTKTFSAGGNHRTPAPPLADDDGDSDDDEEEEPPNKGKGKAADSEHPRAVNEPDNLAFASTPHALAQQDTEIDRFISNGDDEPDDKGGPEDVESPESPMQVENQLTTFSITPSTSAQAEVEDDERPKDKGKGRATGSERPETPTRTENQLTNLIIASTSHRPSTSAQAEAQAAEIARLRAQLAEQTNLVQRHETYLASMQNSLTCQICLDLLYKPYTLSPCGHIACYACLLRWFTTNPNQPADARFDPETIVNGPPVPAAPAPAPPAEPASRPGRHRHHFHFHRRTPTAARQYLHKRKTCPLCRAVVQNRPTEVYTVKEMVGGLSRSLLVELPVPAPAPTPPTAGAHAGNPTNDPWNNVFPSVRNTRNDDDYEYPGIDYFMEERMTLAASVRGAMAEAERRGRAAAAVPAAAPGEHPADPNDMGMRDMQDGGIYRCWDCMHELWGRICSGCGRVYTGHQPEDEDEDNSDDDYSLGARVRELEDLEFDLTDEEDGWGNHHPFEDDEDDHGDPYAALYEEVHRLEPVPLNRHEELEWLRALVPVGRGAGGRVRNGQIIEALRALRDGDEDGDEDDEVIFDEPGDDDSDVDHVLFGEAVLGAFNEVGRRNRRNPVPAQGQGRVAAPVPAPVPHVILSSDDELHEDGGRHGRAARDRAVLHALVASRLTRGNRNAPGPADANPEGMADVWDGVWGDVEVEEVNSDDEAEGNPAVRREGDVVVIGSDSGGEDESDEEVRHVPPPRAGRRRARQEVVEIGSDSEYEGSFIDDDDEDEDAGIGRIRRRREPFLIVVDEDEDEDEDDEDEVGLGEEDDDEEDGSDEDGIAATFALLNQTRGRERSGLRPPITSNSRVTRSSAASSSHAPAVIISSDEDEEEEDRPRRRNGRASGSRQTNLHRRSRRRNPIHDDSDEEDEVKDGLESVEAETGTPSVVVVETDADSEPGIPAPSDKDGGSAGEATAVEEGERERGGDDKEEEEDLAHTIALRRARMAKAAEKRRAGG